MRKVILLDDRTVTTEIIESHWKPAIAFVWPCKINTIKDWGEYTTTLSEKNVNYNNYTKCLKYNSKHNEYKGSSLDFIMKPGLRIVKDRTAKLIATNVTQK